MLSEHSTRAIGLELDFRLISHFAPLSPTRFGFFFCSVFTVSLWNFLSTKRKVHEIPKGALSPAFRNLFCATFSQEKASEMEKERERGRERLEKEIRICATQSNGWQQNRREDGGLADGGIWELWDSEREQEERERIRQAEVSCSFKLRGHVQSGLKMQFEFIHKW